MTHTGSYGRERALAAAVDVFRQFGYRQATMETLAAAAGMSRPALYKMLGNKEQVFRAATAWSIARTWTHIERTAIETKGVVEQVLSILGSGVISAAAGIGMLGHHASELAERFESMAAGSFPTEQSNRDSINYWLITPDDLADAVVSVVDQPWGINLSDVTVRASGEVYIH